LSGGEQRRVTLASLALAAPRLVFADEPTAGLDAARKADALALLADHAGPDRAFVVVTHDLLVARHVCTRLVFMNEGAIVADAPVGSLDTVAHPAARALLAAAHLLSRSEP
jgi:ABC-type dipeptide/oligopeptide/nickel transport system ATPase component